MSDDIIHSRYGITKYDGVKMCFGGEVKKQIEKELQDVIDWAEHERIGHLVEEHRKVLRNVKDRSTICFVIDKRKLGRDLIE